MSLEQNIIVQETVASGGERKYEQGDRKHTQGSTIDNTELSTPIKVFTDGAWNEQKQANTTGTGKAGLVIFMQVQEGQSRWHVQIAAMAMKAQSAINAEDLDIKLETIILNRLGIQEATILIDNLTLAKAAVAREPNLQPVH